MATAKIAIRNCKLPAFDCGGISWVGAKHSGRMITTETINLTPNASPLHRGREIPEPLAIRNAAIISRRLVFATQVAIVAGINFDLLSHGNKQGHHDLSPCFQGSGFRPASGRIALDPWIRVSHL